jgi:M6 family metalloprotease-like protein
MIDLRIARHISDFSPVALKKNHIGSGMYSSQILERSVMISYLLIVILISVSNLTAAPLKNVPITLIQPNGDVVYCYASGDEFYNWAHDKDNYTIIRNRNGYYVYAIEQNDALIPSEYIVGKIDPNKVGLKQGANISSARVQKLKETILMRESQAYPNKVCAPTAGSLNNIVIFIRFKDENEFVASSATYDTLFNAPFLKSVYNYYNEVSYSKIGILSTFYPNLDGIVFSYQDNHPRDYYKPDTLSAIGYKLDQRGPREQMLLRDALNFVSSQIPPEINLDTNNDGQVDNVCFVVSGTTTPWSTLLWPHMSSLYQYVIYINGKKVGNYNFQLQSMLDVGTLCHEMFHSLGGPDLYHYDSKSTFSPAGSWDIMCGGGAHMGAYMKWKYGKWIDAIPEITTPGSYTMSSLVSSPACCYRIPSPYSSNQYFVVEYRRKAGFYESGLQGNGLIVYRIDTRYRGNASGPPDEVYMYRPDGNLVDNGKPNNAFFNRDVGRWVFHDTTNPSCFLTNGSPGGINIEVGSALNVSKPSSTISLNVLEPIKIQSRNDYSVASRAFNWIDIAGSKTGKITSWKNGNQDANGAKDDGWTPRPIPIGFGFTYYGVKYDSIYVGVNGLVSFTQNVLNTASQYGPSGVDSLGYFDPAYFWPGNKLFPNSMAVAYYDWDLNPLDGYGGGVVYYKTVNDQFILSWEKVGSFNSRADTTNSFQLVLDRATNSVIIQFKNFGQDTTRKQLTVGIQKDFLVGLDWVNGGSPANRIPVNGSAIVFTGPTTTGIAENGDVPAMFYLGQNYPNPFNPATKIRYSILEESSVSLKIFDALGREVRTLMKGNQNPGSYEFFFNAQGLASGIYFYRLQSTPVSGAGGQTQVKKMLLLR